MNDNFSRDKLWPCPLTLTVSIGPRIVLKRHKIPSCNIVKMPSFEFHWGYNVSTGNKKTKHVLLLEFSRFSLNHHYKQIQECI